MNIDELEAGPELDALICEKVMGMRFAVPSPPHYPALREKCWLTEDGTPYNIAELHFSESIAQAWKVVEKLGHVYLSSPGTQKHIDREPDQLWEAHFALPTKTKGVHIDRRSSADTAELAICRAALKAVESKK